MNEQKSEAGTITGIVVIIIVLLIGGYYFFQQRIEKQERIQNEINKAMGVSSTSDEIVDLETETNAIDTDSLDEGIENI